MPARCDSLLAVFLCSAFPLELGSDFSRRLRLPLLWVPGLPTDSVRGASLWAPQWSLQRLLPFIPVKPPRGGSPAVRWCPLLVASGIAV